MESHAWSRELLIENESENEELLLKDCFGTSMSAHLQTSHELLGRNEMKVSDEPLGRNCRRTLLTQLTDRFFG
jgi:hypothetical protein